MNPPQPVKASATPEINDRTTDVELLALARAGDGAAFATFHHRHEGAATRVAESICRDRSRSGEAVQEAFLAIWRSSSQYRAERGTVRSWAMAVVRNRAIDSHRAAAVRPAPSLLPLDGEAVGTTPARAAEDLVLAGIEAAALRVSLARLPAAQAEAVFLAFFVGLSYSEVDLHVGVATATAKGRIRLGLREARRRPRAPRGDPPGLEEARRVPVRDGKRRKEPIARHHPRAGAEDRRRGHRRVRLVSAPLSPLGAVGRGLLAGVAGTAAMTAWQELSAKLQSSGEEGESSSAEKPKDPWEEASAPAKVGRRVLEGVFHKEVPAEQIGTLTNVMHWGYGTTWGAVYGLLAGTAGRSTLRGGLAFGTGVWLSSYAELVPMGLYEPPWKYEPGELGMDLSYHLVYGTATALAFAAVSR